MVSELWSEHKYMVEMTMFNVQRVITPKVCKPELGFMCSAHHLIVLYIGVNFCEKKTQTVLESWSGQELMKC